MLELGFSQDEQSVVQLADVRVDDHVDGEGAVGFLVDFAAGLSLLGGSELVVVEVPGHRVLGVPELHDLLHIVLVGAPGHVDPVLQLALGPHTFPVHVDGEGDDIGVLEAQLDSFGGHLFPDLDLLGVFFSGSLLVHVSHDTSCVAFGVESGDGVEVGEGVLLVFDGVLAIVVVEGGLLVLVSWVGDVVVVAHFWNFPACRSHVGILAGKSSQTFGATRCIGGVLKGLGLLDEVLGGFLEGGSILLVVVDLVEADEDLLLVLDGALLLKTCSLLVLDRALIIVACNL